MSIYVPFLVALLALLFLILGLSPLLIGMLGRDSSEAPVQIEIDPRYRR